MQTFVCFFCKNGIFHHLLMHSIHLFCINAFFKKRTPQALRCSGSRLRNRHILIPIRLFVGGFRKQDSRLLVDDNGIDLAIGKVKNSK